MRPYWTPERRLYWFLVAVFLLGMLVGRISGVPGVEHVPFWALVLFFWAIYGCLKSVARRMTKDP